MKREYFCGGCGLFHWADQYIKDETTGKVERVSYKGCPNEDCISHKESDVVIFAVDTMGFAYFAESNKGFIDEVKWSSLKYAPKSAVEVYRKQGVSIRK